MLNLNDLPVANLLKTMRNKQYPFLSLAAVNGPQLDEIAQAVERVVRSGRYVGGPEVERFERTLAEYEGTRYAVGCANGLDALRLIFRGYIEMGQLKAGNKVIVPANTYIASILAVTDCGLTPVLVEPDARTLNLDTRRLRQVAEHQDVKAILTVHLYGRCCYDSEMEAVARELGLLIIEDNAQAIGARCPMNGRRTGALGHAAAFSFYPTKNLGAMGDAGAVTTDDEQLATAVRAIANYGSDRRYHNIYQGLNSRLDPIQAAILNVKLPYLATENGHRQAVAEIYEHSISNSAITRPLWADDGSMVWHQYVIQCRKRDLLRQRLDEKGVATDIHYATPPHRQPCYSAWSGLSLPETERIANTVVSLPISSAVSLSDAREIAAIINTINLNTDD